MIQINEILWEMYHGTSVPKQLYINFPDITLDNSHIFDFSMEESLSSDTDILFGSCEATQFKARVEGVGKDIVGKKCRIYHIVDEQYEMPLGTYIIDSVSKKDDLGYREIIGYDEIYTKLSVDVTTWYKSLAFPMPLKTLRQSLFAYVSIPITNQELILDDLQIERTIEPQSLNGRDVAQAIGEVNGTFGHIGRDGKFKYIHLGYTGLYPAEDLYPSEELFPEEADSVFESSTVFSCVREEYEVAGIDCLQIRQEEGDVGSVVFDTRNYKNPYIITGNFLLYGKNSTQLNEIGRTIFDYIKNRPYTPYTANVIGLPYLEVGDGITFTTKKDNFLSYVMKRKLSGIQSLRDELSASGNQYRDNEVSPNDEIKMVKGKTTKIEKSVDGIKTTVKNLETSTDTKFEQTSEQIAAEAKRAIESEENLSAKIKIEADRITSEVTRAQGAEIKLLSSISQTAQEIRTEVKNAEEGLTNTISQTESRLTIKINDDIKDLSTSINATIEGLTTTVTGLNGDFSSLKQTVEGWTFTTEDGETKISGNYIGSGLIEGSEISTDSVYITNEGIEIADIEIFEDGVSASTSGKIVAGLADQYGNGTGDDHGVNIVIYGSYLTVGEGRRGYSNTYYWFNRFKEDVNGYTDPHVFKGTVGFMNGINTSRMALGNEKAVLYSSEQGIETQSSISSAGNLVCTGTKNRAVETTDYGIVLMNTLETTGAYFSDIGFGKIVEGKCYVYADNKFLEVIDQNNEYHVLVTQTSKEKIYYTKKEKDYFIVYGEDNATFDWIMIAKQKGYETERMESGIEMKEQEIEVDEAIFIKDDIPANTSEEYMDKFDYDLAEEAISYINEENRKENKIVEDWMI